MMLPRKTTSNRPQFISIQGNIGSGKSTVLKIIRQNFPQLAILDEPLSDWQNVGQKKNINLLEIYYKDPSRWGFTFQIYAFMSRLKKWSEYSEQQGDGIKISQRSLLSDRFVFASIMHDMKILDQAEYQIYLQCYEYMLKMKSIVDLSGIIYIRCDPKTCESRIKKRSRQGQDCIPLEYLNRLHQKHQGWLNREQEKENLSKDILIIDNTQQVNKEKIISSVNEWLLKIKQPEQRKGQTLSENETSQTLEVRS